jgi:hypothetical protein
MLDTLHQFYTKKDTQYATHNIHPYPNKMLPPIANTLIQTHSSEGDTILDPFCGSGTVVIEANVLKRNAIGLDINPLACLLSRVKATPINTEKVKDVVSAIAPQHNTLQHNTPQHKTQTTTLHHFIGHPLIPDIPKKEWWFQKHVLHELAVLKEKILAITDDAVKDWCSVAFSAVVKEVSNSSALYKLMYQKKYHPPNIVVYKFREQLRTMRTAYNSPEHPFHPEYAVHVAQHDARQPFQIAGILTDEQPQVDCIITNLPRCNAEFLRCCKIHLWWLHNAHKSKSKLKTHLKELNVTTIGSPKTYKEDMRNVLHNLYAILKPGGYCCLQTADCIIDGEKMAVRDMIAHLAQKAGFIIEQRIQRTIPKKAFVFAKGDKVEEILVLRKFSTGTTIT